MEIPGHPLEPPYQRIAAEIRHRIETGSLQPGDPVPSTRQLTRRYGVAMATATKALSLLRRDGLVEPVAGVGTVVRPRPPARPGPRPVRPAWSAASDPRPHRDAIVRTGIAIADAEGLRAVSMRRIGAELGVGAMALYRYVGNKEELSALMADAVFGEEPLPEPGPTDWLDRLELLARQRWRMYRRHPWVAGLVASLADPPLLPHAIAQVEWSLVGTRALGLEPIVVARAMITLAGYVTGIAVSWATESRSLGEPDGFRRSSDASAVDAIFGSGRFPLVTELEVELDELRDMDAMFEFGLRRQLDGLAAYLGRR
ncbi:TetR/AcrR family transcriptional regulator C-terminal domain-containing protein [Nocardia sp. CDC159]|uniref:TetR/AcrR family transcriptional regulator C-terminal domain-containing protein n=1 Tax=Nocardia pulmonis TaxID=2951408 RepID=A0A9X2IYF9_9NOCA|nr:MULTISPECIES: GntR family transcriptional regulator [Nocardia]MCM6773876.1 TetR/AcrR family transcriptional regulator C-terminal domain-containing protein [Nocardia pulmonis]MCM6786763.1 TetR/AcrR family transcriptional regulator C-terminal domain-containing protein [Nocardia sp. CDC159]